MFFLASYISIVNPIVLKHVDSLRYQKENRFSDSFNDPILGFIVSAIPNTILRDPCKNQSATEITTKLEPTIWLSCQYRKIVLIFPKVVKEKVPIALLQQRALYL